jgi:hypothetical protein
MDTTGEQQELPPAIQAAATEVATVGISRSNRCQGCTTTINIEPGVHQFSMYHRVFVTAIIACIHLVSLLFCFMHVATYHVALLRDLKQLQVWEPTFSASMMSALTLFHLHGVWAILGWCPRRNSLNTSSSNRVVPMQENQAASPIKKQHSILPNQSKTSCGISRSSRYSSFCCCYSYVVHLCRLTTEKYHLYFGLNGVFGLLGPLFEYKLVVKQVIQIPMQMYQAYSIAAMVPDAVFSTVYTLTLAGNCMLCAPLLLMNNSSSRQTNNCRHRANTNIENDETSKKDAQEKQDDSHQRQSYFFRRRWATKCIDTVFDFMLSVGFLVLKLIRTVWALYFLGDQNEKASIGTFMLGKFAVISSPVDGFCTFFLILSTYLSCRTLYHGSQITTAYVR